MALEVRRTAPLSRSHSLSALSRAGRAGGAWRRCDERDGLKSATVARPSERSGSESARRPSGQSRARVDGLRMCLGRRRFQVPSLRFVREPERARRPSGSSARRDDPVEMACKGAQDGAAFRSQSLRVLSWEPERARRPSGSDDSHRDIAQSAPSRVARGRRNQLPEPQEPAADRRDPASMRRTPGQLSRSCHRTRGCGDLWQDLRAACRDPRA